MIVLNLHWMRLRGSKYPYSFMINHNYTEQETRSLLSPNRKEISFDMMLRLTDTFKCRAEDLLDWTGDEHHRMAYLKKPDIPTLEQLMEDKNLEEILAMLQGFRK